MYRSFVSLCRYTPKYFILFLAMVNGIVSLISLSVFSFQPRIEVSSQDSIMNTIPSSRGSSIFHPLHWQAGSLALVPPGKPEFFHSCSQYILKIRKFACKGPKRTLTCTWRLQSPNLLFSWGSTEYRLYPTGQNRPYVNDTWIKL